MKRTILFMIAACLSFSGCTGTSDTDAGTSDADPDAVVIELPSDGVQAVGDAGPSGVFALSPENTKIEFVGTHVGEPRPRTGGFEQFTGQAVYDPASNELTAVSVEIQTDSIWTNVPGGALTNHLKNEDFFDVRQYPTAKFESTSISKSGDGYNITGDFTLLDTTKQLSFPATVEIADGDVRLSGEFVFDRTEWGMDRLQDRVEKEVTLSVVIGEKTAPQVAEGGRGGGGRRGGRGGWDPVERFKEQDANGDGKLVGDEINEFLAGRMETLDSNGDGELTLEEFQEGIRQMFGAGGGGRRGGGGEERPDRPARPEVADDV